MTPKAFYVELPPDASQTLQLAAGELSHYVRTVLGWEAASGQRTGAYRLRLGTRRTSFVFRSFLNQVMKALGDDGFRIVADATTTTFCAETDKGVLNAAYHFLATVLRVRWVEPGFAPAKWGSALAKPGPVGEVLPRREVRAWWPMDLVETPAFHIRGMHLGENARWCREEDVRAQLEWMARNRLNHLVVYANASYERLRQALVEECRRRGVTLEVEVLSFDRFLPTELFDAHPEYFPVLGGGRVGGSFVQRCASSREAVERFVDNCVRWVREHPEAEVVGLTSNEGDGWCECGSCRAETAAEQFSKFLYPALAALRGEFPGRQFASRAGRGRYEPLEPDAECRLGVALMFDTSIRCPWHELGSESCEVPVPDPPERDASGGRTANVYLLNALRAWKSVATAPVYVFENVARHDLVPAPAINPDVLTRDMTTWRSLALDGVIVPGHVHSFGSHVLNLNLFARLAWDLEANYRGLWPDLCVRYFGGYSFRVLDVVERLREAGARRLSQGERRDIERLLGPVPEGESGPFAGRYRRVREGFLYRNELARLDEAGERLRKARAEGDRAAAVAAARSAHGAFLDAWDRVVRNRAESVFDTLDVLAKFITRGTNAEALAERWEWFPRPFWQPAGAARRLALGDYLARLEAEGLSVDAFCARAEGEFAAWRDRFAALGGRLEELVDAVDFGFDRPR